MHVRHTAADVRSASSRRHEELREFLGEEKKV